jgi:hypothetical protein
MRDGNARHRHHRASDQNSYIDNFRTPHTEKLHVTESIKLVDNGTRIEAFVKVDDPDTFYEPLYLIQRWRKVPTAGRDRLRREQRGSLQPGPVPDPARHKA